MKTQNGSPKNMGRRKFIKNTVATSAGITILPRYILGGKGYIPPSDKLNIGVIGVGGQSMFSISELLKLEDVQLITIKPFKRRVNNLK